MLPPLPRCSGWAYSSLISPSRVSLPRKGHRVGLHIDLFEACSAFTRVAACTLARLPIRNPLSEGFSHFVTSMTAPVASGWSVTGWGLHPLESAALSRRTPNPDISLADRRPRLDESRRGLRRERELKRGPLSYVRLIPDSSPVRFDNRAADR